jgi:hypothetical protein
MGLLGFWVLKGDFLTWDHEQMKNKKSAIINKKI